MSEGEQRQFDAAEGQLALLKEENRRLRASYVRARHTRHRRTALGLAAVGAVALIGAYLVPSQRALLVALGATGVFAGVLTYAVTPERFLTASVGEAAYRSVATVGEQLVDELGLADERIYVPPDDAGGDARLFVPATVDAEPPGAADLESLLVVPAAGEPLGIALPPTGGALYRDFERTGGRLPGEPADLAAALADALVEQFELVDRAAPEVDPAGDRLTVGIAGSALGSVDRIDHPVQSVLGVGLATGLDRPVAVDVRPAEDRRYDHLVTCRW